MRNYGYKGILVFTLFAVLGVSASAIAQTDRHRLTLENTSGFDIYEIHLSPTNDPFWGPDLLGSDGVLSDGSSISVTGIESGQYDVELIDQDNDRCVHHNVSIYRNKTWDVTTGWLLGCEFH